MLHEVYPDTHPAEFDRTLHRVRDFGPLDITLVSDGGPWAVHNMPCPVCLNRKAVVDLSLGGFGPCWPCRELGWDLVRRRPRWWQKRHRSRTGVAE